MQPQSLPAGIQTSSTEKICVAALLLAVLILNLATALIYPAVWQDEVMFTDPAANLAAGHGFTSTCWRVQTGDRLWAGNVPLHEIILSGWIKVFGFSPRVVRSINYAWFTAGTFLLWLFCVRAQLIKKTGLRLLLILLLAAGSGVSFSYRSGRADMIDYFLVTLALLATTIPQNGIRFSFLFAIGIFFPWAGLQLLPFLAIATTIVLISCGPNYALNGIATGCGAGTGLFMLFCFYQHFHVWHDFAASVFQLGISQYNHAQWSAVPDVLIRDRSAPLLLLLTILLAWRCWKSHDAISLKIILFGLATGLCIPIGMHFIGIFPIYYGWMAALPVTLAVCQYISLRPPSSLWLKISVNILLFGAIAVGLPIRLTAAILAPPSQSQAVMDRFISSHLKPADEACIDYAAFYPVKTSVKKIFTPSYMTFAMTPEEKKSVNVLVVSPTHFPFFTNIILGDWKLEGKFDANITANWLPQFIVQRLKNQSVHDPYHFVIYRRNSEQTPHTAN